MENHLDYLELTDRIFLNKSKIIGQGSFGRVFQGCDKSTGEMIAIKQIKSEVFAKERALILRQMNILEELKNRKHPNIIRYLGSTEANNTIYFFMELCATSVEEVIKKEGKISENTVFKWFNQILQGLAFLGSQSIMHRDLKPDNLLLDDFGNIKIADLGLAKHDEVMNTLGAGTPLYKAPEVYDDHTYDSRCDVWSLGLILYEMLTGKIFFEGVESIQELRSRHKLMRQGKLIVTMPPEQQKDYDKAWLDIISKMVVYDFWKRKNVKQIEVYFFKISKELQERIKKNISSLDFDSNELAASMRLAEQSYPANTPNQQSLDVFNHHHESFQNFEKLRKYLIYRINVNRIYSQVKIYAKVKRLGRVLPNQYIYALMFSGLGMHWQQNKKLENQLNNEEFTLPNIKIYGKQFDQFHKKQFQELKKQNLDILKASAIQLKKDLIILADKYYDYKNRGDKKQIIEKKYSAINTYAQNFKRSGILPDFETLFKVYFSYLLIEDHKITNVQLYKMAIQQLRAYYLMNVLAHLDEYFSIEKYASIEYLINRKQKLLGESPDTMIQQLIIWLQ